MRGTGSERARKHESTPRHKWVPGIFNPYLSLFRTAVPLWGHTTQISSSLSSKRDCGSKRVKPLRTSLGEKKAFKNDDCSYIRSLRDRGVMRYFVRVSSEELLRHGAQHGPTRTAGRSRCSLCRGPKGDITQILLKKKQYTHKNGMDSDGDWVVMCQMRGAQRRKVHTTKCAKRATPYIELPGTYLDHNP